MSSTVGVCQCNIFYEKWLRLFWLAKRVILDDNICRGNVVLNDEFLV